MKIWGKKTTVGIEIRSKVIYDDLRVCGGAGSTFLKKNHLFLTAHGLPLVVVSLGCSPVAALRLLTVEASPVAEHRF